MESELHNCQYDAQLDYKRNHDKSRNCEDRKDRDRREDKEKGRRKGKETIKKNANQGNGERKEGTRKTMRTDGSCRKLCIERMQRAERRPRHETERNRSIHRLLTRQTQMPRQRGEHKGSHIATRCKQNGRRAHQTATRQKDIEGEMGEALRTTKFLLSRGWIACGDGEPGSEMTPRAYSIAISGPFSSWTCLLLYLLLFVTELLVTGKDWDDDRCDGSGCWYSLFHIRPLPHRHDNSKRKPWNERKEMCNVLIEEREDWFLAPHPLLLLLGWMLMALLFLLRQPKQQSIREGKAKWIELEEVSKRDQVMHAEEKKEMNHKDLKEEKQVNGEAGKEEREEQGG